MAAPKKPQDHQAKAEAKSQDIALTFDGVKYLIERDNADNLELMEFVEDERYVSAIRGFIGLDQWKRWKDDHRDERGRVTKAEFERFLNAVMAAIGGGSEESPNS